VRSACAALLLSAVAGAQTGPPLEVRLKTHLTSYSSKAGTPFECVVLRDYLRSGRVAIPQGSIVHGTVRRAISVGIGLRHERAALELNFDSYEVPGGERIPLAASLASIDNAREHVDRNGRIRGVLAANNPGNLLNGFWARPVQNFAVRSLIGLTGAANQIWVKYSLGPFGAAGIFAAHCLFTKFPEPEIQLPPGTDMKLAVRLPEMQMLQVAAGSTTQSAPNPEFADGLKEWVAGRLRPITYANGRIAPDELNVILLGSRAQIISDFTAAGWSEADQRTWGTSSRVYLAFSSMRSYSSAPVSPLLYRGAEPDLVFEKSFDTVTQRHHVRFWSAGEFQGEPVWLGAATHDSGIVFHTARFTFSHKIDSNIDLERDKVETDLGFAGCSQTALLLPRPGSLARTGQRISTDNNLLVLAMRPCEAAPSDNVPFERPGNRASRLARRIVLETRNYVLRDNAYYWAYHLLRSKHDHTNPLSN